jgi:hypothetical protein
LPECGQFNNIHGHKNFLPIFKHLKSLPLLLFQLTQLCKLFSFVQKSISTINSQEMGGFSTSLLFGQNGRLRWLIQQDAIHSNSLQWLYVYKSKEGMWVEMH